MNIPITRPYFDDAEKQAILQPLDSGWVAQGPQVAHFENLFATYTAAQFARAVSSCTAGLHLALAALGIGPGDEVILPSFTFVASANAIEYQQARPVFVDIDLATFNIDVALVEAAINDKTRAIMPVSLFGLSADMNPTRDLAREHNLLVIEDAACAIGSRYQGHHAGTLADIGCFSLHPRKIITTGEGGMIVTNDPEIAARIEAMRSHGGTLSDLHRHHKGIFVLPEHNILGYNYRMSDLQAAIGVTQMSKLEWIVERRIELARKYDEAFAGVAALATPHVPAGYRHSYQSYVLLVRDESPLARDALALSLQGQGISIRQGTHAVHLQGYYRDKYGLRPDDLPQSFTADRQSLTLPLFPAMTDQEQEYVIEKVLELVC